MSSACFILITVLVAGTFGALPVPFLDFYVPGELVSGPDVSQMFLPEVESHDEVKIDIPSAVEGPVVPELPQTPLQPYQCTESKFIQCVDCESFAVCTGPNTTAIAQAKCDVDRQYCSSGLDNDYCSRTPSPTCAPGGVNPSTFICTSTGYFPDVSNCRSYHICSRDDTGKLVSSDYICPGGYYYEARYRTCRRQLIARECTRRELSCAGTSTPEPLRYPPAPRYYYFCNPSTNQPVLFRCPFNSQYDAFSYECKYNCWIGGNFPHSDNPARFFVCYRESGRLTSRIEQCPDGFSFSKKMFRCLENGNPALFQ